MLLNNRSDFNGWLEDELDHASKFGALSQVGVSSHIPANQEGSLTSSLGFFWDTQFEIRNSLRENSTDRVDAIKQNFARFASGLFIVAQYSLILCKSHDPSELFISELTATRLAEKDKAGALVLRRDHWSTAKYLLQAVEGRGNVYSPEDAMRVGELPFEQTSFHDSHDEISIGVQALQEHVTVGSYNRAYYMALTLGMKAVDVLLAQPPSL